MLVPMIVMLLFPWIHVYAADQCRTAYSQSNLKLQGYLIKSLSTSGSLQCTDECASHGKCHSINFDQDKGICELNDANHLSNPESLVYSHGSQYVNYFKRPVAKCSNKLCSEPLVCKVVDDGLDYNCVKPPSAEVLNFPQKSIADNVVLENPFNVNLTAFTVALWVQADPSAASEHTLFSYATRSEANEIFLLQKTNNIPAFYLKDTYVGDVSQNLDAKWHHLCVSWENTQGEVNFYIDGLVVKSEKNFMIGHVIEKGVIVLGQDQDSYKGGFEKHQSLQGNLTSVNMWDRVLTAQEISDLAKSCTAGEGNIVKWADLKDKGEGEVKLITTSACVPGL